MKKLLIVLLLSGLAFGPLSAQVFTMGPKFGLSQANVEVSDGYKKDHSKMGYHLGVFARINTPIIFIQPEVLYTNTGGSFTDDSFNYDVDFDRLDVPLMVGIKLAGIFRLQAGPIASYMLNSDMSTNDPSISTLVPPKEEFTIGYQAGLGLDIGNFLMDLKYEGPLSNSVDQFAQVPTDQRQNQLILSLGFNLF
ncbi:MAG: outer membrane beta-barrel protein [Cyclobacteriaceae bacterium]